MRTASLVKSALKAACSSLWGDRTMDDPGSAPQLRPALLFAAGGKIVCLVVAPVVGSMNVALTAEQSITMSDPAVLSDVVDCASLGARETSTVVVGADTRFV